MLKSETYAVTAYFNRKDSRTQRPRPEAVKVPVPALVSNAHNAVRRRLESRRPTRTAPRVVNGPTLLTGVAKCDCCTTSEGRRAGMMLRTGKGGRYRCLILREPGDQGDLRLQRPADPHGGDRRIRARRGRARVLAPQCMKGLLEAMLDRQDGARAATEAELHRQEALKKAEGGIRGLYAALADAPDLIRLDDPIYRDQLALLNRQRAEALLAAELVVLAGHQLRVVG